MTGENPQYSQLNSSLQLESNALENPNSFMNKIHPEKTTSQQYPEDAKISKWKFPCESRKCPIGMPVFFQGLALGVFAGFLILIIILSLYLSSIYTGPTTTVTTTVTTMASTTTTTAYYSCSNFTVTVNWNYPGNDIAFVSPMSFPVCCAWCMSTSTCTTFVLINTTATCWIKTSIGTGGGATANVIAATR